MPPLLPEKPSSPEKPTCAHPDFIVVKMHRNQYVPGLGNQRYYFMNIKTSAVSYVPPPPQLDRIDEENGEAESVNNKGRDGLDNFFSRVPNRDSFLKEISGECEVVTTDSETVVQSETEDDSDVKVFTGEYLEKLFMSAMGTQKSYPHEMKSLGIWKDGMLRADCDKALRKYFIEQCGSAEKYFASEIHLAEQQEICRECKLSSQQKRRDLFVEKKG